MKTLLAITFTLLFGCASINMPVDARYTANIFSTRCENISPVDLPEMDGFTWHLAATIAPQKIVCWETVTAPAGYEAQRQLEARCGIGNGWNGNACVMARLSTGTSWVLSTLTIEQAKVYYTHTHDSYYSGKSHVTVWQHEIAHICGNKGAHKCAAWNHDETSIRPITWRN